MTKLLLEIFSEEIPAKMHFECIEKLKKIFCETLDVNTSIDVAVSPRHICIATKSFTLNNKIIIKGPKIQGQDDALKGFMHKHSINDLNTLKKENGNFVFERVLSSHESITALSKNVSIALRKMVWPKSMTWNEHSIKWIRPIHEIVCMLDDKIINVDFGHIKSSNITYGHRSQGSKKINIKSADFKAYCDLLRNNGVIVLREERKKSILDQVNRIIQPMNLTLINDQQLLEEVIGLVEKPYVFIGRIDHNFMSLPTEVLVTSLKNHQKYLLLKDQKGKLAPYFIIVSDIDPDDGGAMIVSGNEKVLRARLSDAQHFVKSDLKVQFITLTEKLHKIQFHKDLGSVYAKVMRIKNFSALICDQLKISAIASKKAAQLCKNDLVTQMVAEFPELQGIIGYYYAIQNGESSNVALAIRDHYKPCGPNDFLPETLVGCIVAIADKLDTLQSFFSIGIKPTSTKDPYALRRAAIGIVRIVLAHKILMNNLKISELGVSNDVIEFILERAKHMNDEYYNIVKVCA